MRLDNHSILGLMGSFGLAVIMSACAIEGTEPNDEHCWYASGDATCKAEFGKVFPYCSNDSKACGGELAPLGCVAVKPELSGCRSPCGGGQSEIQNDVCDELADEFGEGSGSEFSESESGSESADSVSTDSESTGMEGPLSCTSHFQCPGDAGCHLEFGTCLPSTTVYEVGQDGLSFAQAMAMLGGQDGTIRLHGAANYPIESTFPLAQNQVAAIVAADESRPSLVHADVDAESVDFAFVIPSGHLYLWGVDLSGDAGVSVLAGGELHAEKTAFDTRHDAVLVSHGRAELRNCMLLSANDHGAPTLRAEESGVVDVTFSTILGLWGDRALVCRNNAVMNVRNSIVGSLDVFDGFDISASCTPSLIDSATESPFANIHFLNDDFTNIGTGDLHLRTDKFQGIALWSAGDPLDDFDGDPRLVQTPTWPGADVPMP